MRKTFLSAVALMAAASLPALADDPSAEHGAYLARIMDCGGCHSGMTPEGAPDPAEYLTGGTFGFHLPGLGVFWPPNLTPSAEGLGGWTAEDIVRAVREGATPDGHILAPVMPWHSYAVLTDEDAADLAAFLQSLPPSARVTPEPSTPEAASAPYFNVVMPQ